MNNIPNPRAGKIFAGAMLLAIGVVMLLRKSGFYFPFWFITWEMIVIAGGLFIGFRSNFRHPAWFIMLTVGGLFLIENYFESFHPWSFLWPILLIELGLWMIFGRHRSPIRHPHYNSFNPNPEPFPDTYNTNGGPAASTPADIYTTESYPDAGQINSAISSLDFLQVTAILGGSKKIMVSKNFQGGEILTFMGGCEINLVQADIQGRAVLDVTQVMGGIKLIVPANWTVISEITVILGGIDDKRLVLNQAADKLLIIKGTSLMGGLEINSF